MTWNWNSGPRQNKKIKIAMNCIEMKREYNFSCARRSFYGETRRLIEFECKLNLQHESGTGKIIKK